MQGISGLTSFNYTFYGCTDLTGSIPPGLFDKNTLVTDFERTFRNATGITSAVPTLWISHPGAVHVGCFKGVINASNYADAVANGWN